jgi:transposase InsO family protein
MHDELFDGRRLRVLTIVDNFSRVSPGIGVKARYQATDVVIRVDNGPEFVSRELDLWAYTHGVTLDFSRPEKPTDNAFIESFNSRVIVVHPPSLDFHPGILQAQEPRLIQALLPQTSGRTVRSGTCPRSSSHDPLSRHAGTEGQKDRNLSLRMVQLPGSPH